MEHLQRTFSDATIDEANAYLTQIRVKPYRENGSPVRLTPALAEDESAQNRPKHKVS
jgi:hypothetical protein